MSSRQLPLELIETIINDVALLCDADTLKACSLVSLAFTFPSQKHLFRVIDLESSRVPRRKRYHRFYKLLLRNPQLGSHVRELRLGGDKGDGFGHFGARRSWISKKRSTLSQMLTFIPRLEAFCLSFYGEMASWKVFPADTQVALAQLLALPSLQFVSMEFISNIPVNIIASLTSLPHVSMSYVEVDTSVVFDDTSPREASTLQSLSLNNVGISVISTVEKFLSISSPPSLRKLTFSPCFAATSRDILSHLLNSTASSNLVTLRYLNALHFYSHIGPVNPAHVPNLKHLHFNASFQAFPLLQSPRPFEDIVALLTHLTSESKLSTYPTIETIRIDCHSLNMFARAVTRESIEGSCDDSEAMVRKMDGLWRTLDKLLASSSPVLSSLRRVEIRLSTCTSSKEDRECFMRAFDEKSTRGRTYQVEKQKDPNATPDFAARFMKRVKKKRVDVCIAEWDEVDWSRKSLLDVTNHEQYL